MSTKKMSSPKKNKMDVKTLYEKIFQNKSLKNQLDFILITKITKLSTDEKKSLQNLLKTKNATVDELKKGLLKFLREISHNKIYHDGIKQENIIKQEVEENTKDKLKGNEIHGLITLVTKKVDSNYNYVKLGIIEILLGLNNLGKMFVGKLGELAALTLKYCTGTLIKGSLCFTMLWGFCSYVSTQNLNTMSGVTYGMLYSLQTLCTLLPIKAVNNFAQMKDRDKVINDLEEELQKNEDEIIGEEKLKITKKQKDKIEELKQEYKKKPNRSLRGSQERDEEELKRSIDEILNREYVPATKKRKDRSNRFGKKSRAS